LLEEKFLVVHFSRSSHQASGTAPLEPVHLRQGGFQGWVSYREFRVRPSRVAHGLTLSRRLTPRLGDNRAVNMRERLLTCTKITRIIDVTIAPRCPGPLFM